MFLPFENWKMSLLSSRACIGKCSFPPFCADNRPWNSVAPVLFHCLCTCVISCAAAAPEMSNPLPPPTSDSAGGFPRTQVVGTVWPRDRREMRLQSALFLGARNKCVPPIYLSLSVSFFARAAINMWLLVRNNSFGTFTEKCMSLLVWFSLCMVKGILAFMMMEEGEEEKKYSSGEVMLMPTFQPMYF